MTTFEPSTTDGAGSSPPTLTSPYSTEQLLASVDRELIDRSPADLAQVVTTFDPEPWIPYDYLRHINGQLLDLVDPDNPMKRLLITVPFRHGKSYFCSTFFPAWYLNKYPHRRVILASYSDDFAAKWGRDVRNLIEANPNYFSIRISKSSSAANQWQIEGNRGGMKTAGAGGGILGWGAHLFIVDDPHGTEDWDSATERDNRWRWWNGPAHSRLEPGAAVCVIGTRWHTDDFIGRLLREQRTIEEGGIWNHIHFPAIAEEVDILGRKPGDALCPERYDIDALTAIKSAITPQMWLSGYQQRPAPEGGGRFKEKEFRFWSRQERDDDSFVYLLHDDDETSTPPESECGRFITVDTALSEKTSADYSVAAVWDVAGWLSPPRLILRHLVRTRMEGADHLHWLQDLHHDWKPTWIGIEEVSLSMTLISQCQRVGLPVRKLRPEKDKYGRSETAVIMLQNHRIYFPKHASWYRDFAEELLSFPAATHDDQVDVLSYGAREFATGYGIKPRPKEPEAITHEDRIRASLKSRHQRGTVHPMLGKGF